MFDILLLFTELWHGGLLIWLLYDLLEISLLSIVHTFKVSYNWNFTRATTIVESHFMETLTLAAAKENFFALWITIKVVKFSQLGATLCHIEWWRQIEVAALNLHVLWLIMIRRVLCHSVSIASCIGSKIAKWLHILHKVSLANGANRRIMGKQARVLVELRFRHWILLLILRHEFVLHSLWRVKRLIFIW